MQNGNGNTVLFTVIGVATLLVALVGATFAYFTASINNSSSQSISIVTAAPIALVTDDTGTAINMENAVPNTTRAGQGFTIANTAANAIVSQTYDLSLVIDANTFTTECTTDANTVCNDATTLAALKDQLELKITATTGGSSTLKMATNTDGAENSTGAQTTDALLIAKASNAVTYNLTNGVAGANNTDNATLVPTGKTIKLVNDQVIAVNETHTYALEVKFKEVGYNQNANSGSKTFTAHLKVDDVKMLSNQ